MYFEVYRCYSTMLRALFARPTQFKSCLLELANGNFTSIFGKGTFATSMNFMLRETHKLFLFIHFYCLFNFKVNMVNLLKLESHRSTFLGQ